MSPRAAPLPRVVFAKTFGRFARIALRMRLGLGPLVNVRALTRVAACLERGANTPTRNIAKTEWREGGEKKGEVNSEARDVSRWFIYLHPALRASSARALHHSIADPGQTSSSFSCRPLGSCLFLIHSTCSDFEAVVYSITIMMYLHGAYSK